MFNFKLKKSLNNDENKSTIGQLNHPQQHQPSIPTQQWFMMICNGQFPMLNAPKNRSKRLIELKSIAKSSLNTVAEHNTLMMKIEQCFRTNDANNNNINNDENDDYHIGQHDQWLQLSFYTPKDFIFQYSVDCRKLDLFKRSKKDPTFFYFSLIGNEQDLTKYQCHVYHVFGKTNADFLTNLIEKRIIINNELEKKMKKLAAKKLSTKQIDTTMMTKTSMSLPLIEQGRNCPNENPLDESIDELACSLRAPLMDLNKTCELISPTSTSSINTTLSDCFTSHHHQLLSLMQPSTNPFLTDNINTNINSNNIPWPIQNNTNNNNNNNNNGKVMETNVWDINFSSTSSSSSSSSSSSTSSSSQPESSTTQSPSSSEMDDFFNDQTNKIWKF